MDSGSNGEEPTSWEELYNINLMPSELFLKFRKEIQGMRLGVNLEVQSWEWEEIELYSEPERSEPRGVRFTCNLLLCCGENLQRLKFYNAPCNEYQAKLVLKPLSPDKRWKFIYEPTQHDVRIISKKIPVTKYLNVQVGIGHNFRMHATGWKWKLTTCFGGDGISRIRNKTTLGLCPGVDFRFGWRADYVLPEITGALGTGEPLFNLQSGKFQASLDRVEAILTHSDAE